MNNKLKVALKERQQIVKKYGSRSPQYNRVNAKIWAIKNRKKFLARMERYRTENPEYASFRVLKHKYLKEERNKVRGFKKLSRYLSKDKSRLKFLKKV